MASDVPRGITTPGRSVRGSHGAPDPLPVKLNGRIDRSFPKPHFLAERALKIHLSSVPMLKMMNSMYLECGCYQEWCQFHRARIRALWCPFEYDSHDSHATRMPRAQSVNAIHLGMWGPGGVSLHLPDVGQIS